ncbi:hypothetical protein GCM10009091_14790 [Pseudomonas brenneri]|nr:hypothetical protein GCM10009091_14790 [Pseudomonas brenneri]
MGGQAQASKKNGGQQLENDGHTLRLRLSQVKEKLWIGDLQAANLNFYCAADPQGFRAGSTQGSLSVAA